MIYMYCIIINEKKEWNWNSIVKILMDYGGNEEGEKMIIDWGLKGKELIKSKCIKMEWIIKDEKKEKKWGEELRIEENEKENCIGGGEVRDGKRDEIRKDKIFYKRY